MTEIKKVTIIGAGKVGSSLSKALESIDVKVRLVSRDVEHQRLSVQDADLILLTVQDKKIKSVCDKISHAISKPTFIAHCSGSLSSEVLSSARSAGCLIASAHPLNTFSDMDSAKKLLLNKNHNTHCFISGDEQPSIALQHLFARMGFIPHIMKDSSKVAYHTACVFACNYLVSLSEISMQSAERAGLDRVEFWEALQPLIRSTLDNVSFNGAPSALSGPIARGDIPTIEQHLEHLESGPLLTKKLYTLLGQQAVALAADRHELPDHLLEQLKETLS